MTTSLNALVTCVAGDGDPYVKVQFKDLADAQRFHASLATIAKPVAWRHTLRMELGQNTVRLAFNALSPFGVAGKDYDKSYTVLVEPLYAAPIPALSERDAPQAQAIVSRHDWFAGQALAGLLAFEGTSASVEKNAHRIAEDMIAARPSTTEAMPEALVAALDDVAAIWDDATNAVCQTMQDAGMCGCTDGKCLAATVEMRPTDAARYAKALTRPCHSTTEAKPVEALVEALKRAEKLQDWYLTALMDIERVRAKYGATGFPVDFHGREMDWVQDRARMAIENDPSARALDSDKEQRK